MSYTVTQFILYEHLFLKGVTLNTQHIVKLKNRGQGRGQHFGLASSLAVFIIISVGTCIIENKITAITHVESISSVYA